MKKLLLLFAVLAMGCAMLNSARAQVPISVGGKLGINFSTISYDPDLPSAISKSGGTGFAFGGVVEMGVGGPAYIQVEPMYISKGSSVEGPIFVTQGGQQVNGKTTNSLSFFEIPILFKAKFPAGPVKPYGLFGPVIGFTLSAKSKDEPQGFPSEETDVKDKTSSTYFGLAFGGGAEFKVAPMISLTGDIRYVLGLNDLSKDQPAQQGQQQQAHQSVKASGFQFFVGALFHLGK